MTRSRKIGAGDVGGGSDNRVGIRLDSLINAAARALAAGDPFGALNRVALRDDPPALALRGIAMAQLGDFAKARALLRNAARSFGAREAVARARCVVAEAEVALAARDLAWPTRSLEAARATLERHADRLNAAHARLLEIRHLAWAGRLDDAERMLGQLDPAPLPPALRAAEAMLVAGIAARRVQAKAARAALARARDFARRSGIGPLMAEVAAAAESLDAPAASRVTRQGPRMLRLDEVEKLLASRALVVDACRYVVRHDRKVVALARRPVLFALARELATAWPADVPRVEIIERVFRTRRPDETHRARLRVEMGRLRSLLADIALVQATAQGFALAPRHAPEVVVIAPPVAGENAAVLALLADGEAWSSSALALALNASQRTVQRALEALAESGKVQSIGEGRARRWMAPPLRGFATTLLLPVAVGGR